MILKEAIEKRQAEEIESIRANAMEKARRVAILLKEKYGAKRVILFGSLCSKKYLHKRSDIDLLVEGIKTSDILRAGFDAWIVAEPFDVDIIPMEVAEEIIIKIAVREGTEL
ncbi:MAG: nucleotidyltransferase domain-containing protein [Nitrospirota bacterium]